MLKKGLFITLKNLHTKLDNNKFYNFKIDEILENNANLLAKESEGYGNFPII